MTSTIETLERELGEAQSDREKEQRAVVRAENTHEATCSARDESWTERFATDPEVERLSTLVYQRRRELYEAIDRLKAAEAGSVGSKVVLCTSLPAERRRYLLGAVDEEFKTFLATVKEAYDGELPDVEIEIVTEKPGEVNLRATPPGGRWRGFTRAPCAGGSEIRAASPSPVLGQVARQISYYAGGHVPRIFAADEETRVERFPGGREDWKQLSGYDGHQGRLTLARITTRRYLDENAVGRLAKRPETTIQIAEVARLYQTLNLTGDEIRWRLEQLISLRLEVLEAVYRLTSARRRFSFYEIARAARLLDSHFPDSGVAAEVLLRVVDRAVESGAPLVDLAYLSVNTNENY